MKRDHWRGLLLAKRFVPMILAIGASRVVEYATGDLWWSLLALAVTWLVLGIVIGEVMHAYAHRKK